ncbi:MAG: methyltransferase domain-containing protein [Candidatus Aenigmatarchaeota archaeon]|jgi:predicted RNA methylase
MLWKIFLAIITVFLFKVWIDLLRNEAIFVPLPKNTIRKMLRVAKISDKDIVYDLGCGDGRVLVIAAKEFGAKAIGIEKSYLLSKIAEWKIKKEKLDDKVRIINKDFFKVNLSNATVIFAYLSKKINRKLEPKLKRELKKGTKILSASHEFNSFKLVKKFKTGHFYSYFYIV